jgi:hypothetical protein
MKTTTKLKIIEMLQTSSIFLAAIGSSLFVFNFFMSHIRETEGWFIASGAMVIVAYIVLLISLGLQMYFDREINERRIK